MPSVVADNRQGSIQPGLECLSVVLALRHCGLGCGQLSTDSFLLGLQLIDRNGTCVVRSEQRVTFLFEDVDALHCFTDSQILLRDDLVDVVRDVTTDGFQISVGQRHVLPVLVDKPLDQSQWRCDERAAILPCLTTKAVVVHVAVALPIEDVLDRQFFSA
ncbi:MAG: hypothetical protein QM774_00135 [Gordonia sp. (in: high G+C Gram-positive bacteria)]